MEEKTEQFIPHDDGAGSKDYQGMLLIPSYNMSEQNKQSANKAYETKYDARRKWPEQDIIFMTVYWLMGIALFWMLALNINNNLSLTNIFLLSILALNVILPPCFIFLMYRRHKEKG